MAKGRTILVVSHFGGVGELCKRFLVEGNRVIYCIKDKPSQDINDGLIPKVKNWEPYVAQADLIVFDDTNFGKVADELRAQGKAVVGPCPYSDKLEMDRGFGSEEMKKAGMTVIPDWNFTSFDEAIAFVKQNPGRYVAKPSGKAQDEKALTYVGKQDDGSDVLAILDNYKKKWGHKIHEIQLQQFVKGVEIACGGFFNGKEFIQPIFINTEYKKFMNDDLGPNCGESGTTAYWQRGGRLYHETLEKMAAPLRAAGYSGYFDINLICTKEAAYPLEFTPRFGFPTVWLQMEGIKSNLGDFFDALGNGNKFNLQVESGFQMCVVCTVAPYPFEDPEGFKKYAEGRKLEFKDPTLSGIYLSDVKLVGNEWVLAGNSGYAVICVGLGQTMEEAKENVYERVKSVSIPDMAYRTDIGFKWNNDRDKLQAWGWI